MKCDYGCGHEGTFLFKNGKYCCSENVNKCEGKRNRDILKKIGKSSGRKGVFGIPAWNKGLDITNEFVKKGCDTFKERMINGEIQPSFLNKHHSIESRESISKSMKGNRNANHRGDRQSYHNGIRMDSSWEVKTAKYFDEK